MKAKNSAPLAEDADLSAIKKLMDGGGKPKSILSYGVEVGSDMMGEPAMWVDLRVKESEVSTSRTKIRELSSFIDGATVQLVKGGLSRRPFFRVVPSRGR